MLDTPIRGFVLKFNKILISNISKNMRRFLFVVVSKMVCVLFSSVFDPSFFLFVFLPDSDLGIHSTLYILIVPLSLSLIKKVHCL